jgi:hypothetical protein
MRAEGLQSIKCKQYYMYNLGITFMILNLEGGEVCGKP